MDRNVLHQLSYGVYAVTTLDGRRQVGCIANSAMQVTSKPATVAVSINHDNFTCGCVMREGRFALCVLGEDADQGEIGTLGYTCGRDVDKFATVAHIDADGLAVPSDSIGYGLFKVISSMESSTHTVFLGEMYEGEMLSDGVPMTYAYYRNVRKGSSPKNAPTYEAPVEKEKVMAKKVWKCTVCGYEYDGEVPFEELPDDWTCPVCGVGKDAFEQVDA